MWTCVLTFEELQALFDSKDIDLTTLEEDVLDNASYYGRIFARSGGLSDAVAEGLKEQGLDDFEVQALRLRRHRGLPHGAAQEEPRTRWTPTSSRAWPASAAASAARAA